MHDPPAEGNFCDEHGNAIKPTTVGDYNRHMGYAEKSDRMSNSYSISCQTWKRTKKLFFYLLDLTILNSFTLWCETVTSRLLSHPCAQHAGTCYNNIHNSPGRPPAPSSTISHLDEANRHHWPTYSAKRMNCHVCSAHGKRSTLMKCKKCDAGLCILGCFENYDTKATFS
jgi:hypothetical protein